MVGSDLRADRAPDGGRLGDATLVRLKVRTNSGVKVPVGQSTGCP